MQETMESSVARRVYRFRLEPTAEQEHRFREFAGARRRVWNWALQQRQEHYQKTGKSLPQAVLSARLTALKDQPETAWLREVDAQLLQQVLADLGRAFVNQQHPAIGERMLVGVPFLHEILPAVRHHHERWDGRGYPDGLRGLTLPRDAAILAVADSIDAMTSKRTYRAALPPSEARRRVHEGSGTQFDPRAVAAFEQATANGTLTLPAQDNTAVADGPYLMQAS